MTPEQHKQIFFAGAADTGFFAKTFFPKTFRQNDPPYAKQIYEIAEDPAVSHAMLLIFRGGSKTTQAKAILAKRVAYSISKTMLLVSQSQAHSIRTLLWLKKQIEGRNPKFAEFFKLSPAMDKITGRPVKWTEDWICIHNGLTNEDIHVVAVGIEGQTRGLNIDDFRPDFILGDDVADDLNSGNEGPRQNVIDNWTGAIEKSLAPKSENPFAKILMLQTPIAEGDIVDSIKKDPRYKVFEMPCFVKHTGPDGTERFESAWPARWDTATLMMDKAAHIKANKLKMWMREMELSYVDVSNQLLPSHWLEITDGFVDTSKGMILITLDPTPPPKPGKPVAVNEKLDDTALVALYFSKTERVILDRWTIKSPDTGVVVAKVFDFVRRWRPFKLGIETILFARTLAHDIIKAQEKEQCFFAVHAVEDKRAKPVRIVSEITKWCQHRPLKIHPSMTDIYTQWIGFDGNPSKHDDLLDAISIAFMLADQFAPLLDSIEGEYTVLGEEVVMPAITYEDDAP